MLSKDPLQALKAGISQHRSEIKTCNNDLLACLARQKKISEADEAWLDHKPNLVDEKTVIELLEKASNYEHGFAQLDSHQKSLVEQLLELEGGKEKVVGNKRNCPKN
ncbi:hypothetical protein C0993_006192 [Termitomyces sp. T159_Od127]|nr:hypothetical protein C0993_006192 [Termitomyces sp. T159_Od127]